MPARAAMRTHGSRLLLSLSVAALLAALAWAVVGGPPDAVEPQVVGMPAQADALAAGGADSAAAAPYRYPHPFPYAEDDTRYPIPIGGIGPAGAPALGPLQYPFLCETARSGLGQPEIDNHDGHGVPVRRVGADGLPGGEILGYSRDCLIRSRIDHYYKPVGSEAFVPWSAAATDVDTLRHEGRDIPFVLRVERGSLNRFLYAIVVLADPAEAAEAPDGRYWNRRLIYLFGGGVGIGRRQGRLALERILERNAEALARGYALVTSTGNHSSVHYNMVLAGHTALRVKRQFVARYGAPLYTVGLGGSGGGLQQYLFAQNLPGLLDAAIPQYAYPDMVTQTTHALDCELLEYYFDVAAADTARWRDHEARRQVGGLNALNGVDNRYAVLYPPNLLLQGRLPRWPAGASECVQGWRRLTPLVLNPRFTPRAEHYAEALRAQVNWTYWDDLAPIYGLDGEGHGRRTWDNVGVQYGLQALRRGELAPEAFLELNARIGGWQPAAQMKPERLYRLPGLRQPLWLSLWSAHNMTHAAGDGPAPRSTGDVAAMEAAYRSGQVFLGYLDIPVIDLRHDREAELDMHHISASFAARARIVAALGDSGRQAIWVAHPDYDPTPRALAVIDDWLQAMRTAPERGVAGNRPPAAADSCFDAAGGLIALGDGVWDGVGNARPAGPCSAAFQVFGTSRTAAGGPLGGDLFKCRLQSVDAAIAAGEYGAVDMRAHADRLRAIFPDGVCDYRLGDAGRPLDAVPAHWRSAVP